MSTTRRALLASGALFLLACGDGGGTEPRVAAIALRVTPTAPSLRLGERVQLHAAAVDAAGRPAVPPAGPTVVWTSEDTAIAVVSAMGEVRAVRPGSVTLRATAGALVGSTTATVRPPTPQLAAAARVTARVGPAGGTLVATSGGRRYVLTVPRDALLDSVEITLTPLAGMSDLPAGAMLLAGADFAPAGLRFLRPATLRVEGADAGALDPRRLAGFGYGGTGADIGRAPVGVRADTLVFRVPHFSGTGVLDVPLAAELPLPPRPGLEDAYVHRLAVHASFWRFDASYPIGDSAAAVLQDWYAARVRPALDAVESDTSMMTAFSAFATWFELVQCGGSSPCVGLDLAPASPAYLWPDAAGAVVRSTLAATLDDAYARTRQALERAIGADVAECRTTDDLEVALKRIANATHWERWLVLFGGSAGADVVARCVRVVFQSVTFPATITGGTAATLAVQAGLSFAERPPVHRFNLNVVVQAGGAAPSGAEGSTATADGRWSTTFTPTGAEPVLLGIRARWVGHGLDERLRRDTLVERALGVTVALTPTAAILDLGATATFAAAVSGTTNPAVTWTATGGTFTVSGTTLTYTAGSAPGTYAVTARSVADPTKSASAPITILAPAGGPTVAITRLYQESLASIAGGGGTCSRWDTVATATGIPGSEDTRADCAGASGGAGVALGRYTITGTAGAASAIVGEGSADGSATAANGQYSTVTRLRLNFEVPASGARFDLTGLLEATIADTASGAKAHVLVVLGGGNGDVLRRQVGRTVGSEPVVPPLTLAEGGRLAAGRYELTIIAGSDGSSVDGRARPRGAATYTFRLTFSP